MADDLIIFTRTFDLLDWLLPRTTDFPRAYRHSLTQRLLDAALDCHEALYAAHSQGGSTRERHLRTADARLDALRVYLRLAHRWHWLSDGQYRHVSGIVAEIGRLLGGWRKQASARKR